ncbi:MAG: phage tail tube protein [Sphingobium sp.]
MAINPADTTYAIIKETIEGTTPASGVLLKLDYIPGDMPSYTSDVIESQTLKASRASAGTRKVGFKAEGGIKTHFKRDDGIELLLTSALSSGAWVETGTAGVAGDTIKAGNTDTSFTIEKKMVDGSSSYYQRFNGLQVSKFDLSCEASGNAEASFSFLGMGRTTALTASALTYANSSQSLALTGLDMGTVSVAGLTGISYRSLSLSVEHDREARDAFGLSSAVGIGTSGFRKVKLSLQFYRKDFTPEAVLTPDTPIAVSFTIGSGSAGYTFTLPAAIGSLPMDEEDGSKALVSVDFAASYDNTLATDLMITRL